MQYASRYERYVKRERRGKREAKESYGRDGKKKKKKRKRNREKEIETKMKEKKERKKKRGEEDTILKEVASTNYFAACKCIHYECTYVVNRTILPGRITIRVKLQYNKV